MVEPSANSGVLRARLAARGPKRTGNLGLEKMNERKPVEQPRPMETANLRNRKSSSKPAKLSREVQARLGQQLRAMYDDVVNQGVPDRFAELINRINGDGSKDRQ